MKEYKIYQHSRLRIDNTIDYMCGGTTKAFYYVWNVVSEAVSFGIGGTVLSTMYLAVDKESWE